MATATPRPRRGEPRILDLRRTRVVLDQDLATAYGVTTGQLNQAVRRNSRRFPDDFAFQLSDREQRNLKSQSVMASGTHGGRRSAPWAFTEHGAIMAASVLNTPTAIRMSVRVVRAFVRLRMLAGAHAELAAALAVLERRVTGHDEDVEALFAAIRRLLGAPARPRRAIGFRAGSPVTGAASVRR